MRIEARRRGMSVAEFTRAAIERALPAPPPDGRLSFFDLGPNEGPVTDDARHLDEIVGQAVAQRLAADRGA